MTSHRTVLVLYIIGLCVEIFFSWGEFVIAVFGAITGLVGQAFSKMEGNTIKALLLKTLVIVGVTSAPFVPVALIPILRMCGYNVKQDEDGGFAIVMDENGNKISDLKSFRKLVDRGVITEEDYAQMKEKILEVKTQHSEVIESDCVELNEALDTIVNMDLQ